MRSDSSDLARALWAATADTITSAPVPFLAVHMAAAVAAPPRCRFRPCIDLRGGAVVQIVGGTLRDEASGAVWVAFDSGVRRRKRR